MQGEYDIGAIIALLFLLVVSFAVGLVLLIDDKESGKIKRASIARSGRFDTPPTGGYAMSTPSSERLLTLNEVAEDLGIDRMTVYYRLLSHEHFQAPKSISNSSPQVRVGVHRLQFLRPNVHINLGRHDRRMP